MQFFTSIFLGCLPALAFATKCLEIQPPVILQDFQTAHAEQDAIDRLNPEADNQRIDTTKYVVNTYIHVISKDATENGGSVPLDKLVAQVCLEFQAYSTHLVYTSPSMVDIPSAVYQPAAMLRPPYISVSGESLTLHRLKYSIKDTKELPFPSPSKTSPESFAQIGHPLSTTLHKSIPSRDHFEMANTRISTSTLVLLQTDLVCAPNSMSLDLLFPMFESLNADLLTIKIVGSSGILGYS